VSGTADEDAHARFLRSRPPRAGLLALVEHLEPGATIAGVRRLKGGLEASTHRLDLLTRSGTRRRVVLRRFNDTFHWFDPARIPAEVATLTSLAATTVSAPEVVLVDAEGRWMGMPCLVVTCLPGGHAPFGRWVERSGRLAAALAEVHAVAPVVDPEPWLTPWRQVEPPDSRHGPWLDRVWPVIQDHDRDLEASAGDALVHHDFHPGNTLWSRGQVSGIVDWPLAGRGFPAYDRAYLRLDVSIALGLEAGDAIAAASAATGIGADHPAWDLVAGLRALPDPDLWVSSYVELGIPITVEEGRARLAAWFERAMAQLR
jgi:aminoglycoside phosphotransferase (APT) family kinase protein